MNYQCKQSVNQFYMQLYSLNSIHKSIGTSINTKITWCKIGCKLVRWQSVSNAGELNEFAQ